MDREESHESGKFYCFKLSLTCEDDDRKRSFTSLCLKELHYDTLQMSRNLDFETGRGRDAMTDSDFFSPLGIYTEEIT